MSLRKYGQGKILRNKEEERERKVAAKNFTKKDREELAEELAEDKPKKDDDE